MDLSTHTAAIPRAIPANLKAAPDLLALIGKYGNAKYREGYLTATDRTRTEYGDSPSMEEITEEVERLQGAEFERDELIEASRGVLLVLSLLERHMDLSARQVVEAFKAALQECKS